MAGIVGVEPALLVHAYHTSWRQRLVQWDMAQTIWILAGRLGGSPCGAQIARAAGLRRELAGRLLGAVAPTTLGVLDRLRAAGWRLALVSNATAETPEVWPDSPLAGRFDAVAFSSVVGAAKPAREIYLAAAEALGAPPGECGYVGDGADDELAGAAALGMRAIRTTEHTDSDPSWPGETVASLTELTRLLKDLPDQ
jgi:putative hydrolase of the HAD superfamily